jgi:hypothetical protein
MAILIPRKDRDSFTNVAIEDQTRLTAALTLLFDLLEEYSPLWYEKRHHDKAKAALRLHERTLNDFRNAA